MDEFALVDIVEILSDDIELVEVYLRGTMFGVNGDTFFCSEGKEEFRLL